MTPFLLTPRIIVSFILLINVLNSHAQEQIKMNKGVHLKNIFNPGRIEQARYKLIMYNQSGDTLTNITIIERQISRENFQSVSSIKITETNLTAPVKSKIIMYCDAKTLKPLHFESYTGDTLTQKADFKKGNLFINDIKNSIENKSDFEISENIFLSNSFSELVQSNNFGKTPIVNFETVSPGRPSSQFIVERIGEKLFPLLKQNNIACWVLKFTRIDTEGKKTVAGYRYVDKKTGKVLLYKSDIESNKFFTYQIIFL